MPQDNKTVYLVKNGEIHRQAIVLERRSAEAYVHYLHTDKRLDEWVPETSLELVRLPTPLNDAKDVKGTRRKRSRSTENSSNDYPSDGNQLGHTLRYSASPPAKKDRLTESHSKVEDTEAVIEHAKITARRNFDRVIFGRWQMKTWYFSPYPLSDDHDPLAAATNGASASGSRTAGRQSPSGRASPAVGSGALTNRAHGRIADILAAGMVGHHTAGENSTIWVCDKCFKYMREHISWEVHTRKCDVKHPPGRKVYEKGAHTIWEVDGATDKLYCQNLALFGKFFIDIKTIFFDTDNFFFYVFTDGDSQRDHVLGFFSKEKVSYDDWNLACIITFPPYQKKGYGMVMIEFSYELSRRSGRLGTPERPLSDLGLRVYLTYWTSVLVRFFRQVLAYDKGQPSFSPGHHRRGSLNRKKNLKGWHGELKEVPDVPPPPIAEAPEIAFGSLRTTHTVVNPEDGSCTSHLNIRCTLMDIARATNLRHEDVAFTLEECGFLVSRKKEKKPTLGSSSGGQSTPSVDPAASEGDQGNNAENNAEMSQPDDTQEIIVISKEMVERVAKERNARPLCLLNQAHVLL